MHGLPEYRSLIAGERVTGHVVEAISPATAAPFACFHAVDAERVDAAVQASRHAFASWRHTPLHERRSVLIQLADLIGQHSDLLARLLTMEQGKPLAEARMEVAGAEALFRHFAAVRDSDALTLFDSEDDRHRRFFSPVGVVAGIVPWNFPLALAALKIAPALLTGNTIIIKPSPKTPIATLEFASIVAASVPSGVLQVLGDAGNLGPMLVAHPQVRKVAFTGSAATGRNIMAAAARDLKRLTLELGGNDPAVVLADAEPAATAEGIFAAAFGNAGQVCGAVKRVYVHEEIHESFCDALAARLRTIVVGDGLRPGVTMGPVQNRAHHRKSLALLADASDAGTVRAQVPAPQGPGYFIPPTLLTELDDAHPLVAEEQFAPLLPVQSFKDDAEAMARANATSYGLTASIWSRDVQRAEALAGQFEASLICINKHNACPLDLGICMTKQSGSGWLLGDEGIQEYLQPHLIVR